MNVTNYLYVGDDDLIQAVRSLLVEGEVHLLHELLLEEDAFGPLQVEHLQHTSN